MSKENRKHGVIDQVKYRGKSSKIKLTDREYPVQENYDIEHKDVRMYCDTNRFPTLTFCGSYPKPLGERGIINHYHLRFDPKLGHGICAIFRKRYVTVLHLYQFWKNLGFVVLSKQNRHATNLSLDVLIGQF